MSRNDLPSESATNFSARLRETMQTMLGLRGDKLDRAVTLRDLVENGFFELSPGSRVSSGVVSLVPGAGWPTADGSGGNTGGGGDPGTVPVYVPDLTPPPTPGVLTLTAAISHILVEVPNPTYTQGHGHLRTRIYGVTRAPGAPLPTFSNAVEVGQFTGTVWAMPSNPATTWHLWAKWETRDNVLSVTPTGDTNGVVATTGQNVQSLLDALVGQITESQLYNALGERINLIDGAGPDSVTARLLAEAQARGVAIQSESAARISADEALAYQISQISAGTGGSIDTQARASILTESQVRADADEALASQITTLTSTVNGNTAAIQTEASTRATQTGELFAQYTVKIDVNGYVSGFGLASTANNDTPFSEFAVRADRFYIASPSGPGVPPSMPFIVRTTPSTDPAGVTIPAGVYMDTAFMRNFVATRGQIGLLAVDDARIASLSAGKLTAGSVAVGQYIQSSGYIPSTAGWRIDGNGAAEFSGVVVRGSVFATNGTFSGTVQATSTILGGTASSFTAGAGFFSGDSAGAYRWRVGSASGSRIQWNGSNVEIYGPTGTLAFSSGGGITAAQISGLGAFATVNQISTANISTLIANAAIGAAQIGSIALTGTANFSVKSATAGQRMEMDSRAIKVFDTNGVLRVQLGDLAV